MVKGPPPSHHTSWSQKRKRPSGSGPKPVLRRRRNTRDNMLQRARAPRCIGEDSAFDGARKRNLPGRSALLQGPRDLIAKRHT